MSERASDKCRVSSSFITADHHLRGAHRVISLFPRPPPRELNYTYKPPPLTPKELNEYAYWNADARKELGTTVKLPVSNIFDHCEALDEKECVNRLFRSVDPSFTGPGPTRHEVDSWNSRVGELGNGLKFQKYCEKHDASQFIGIVLRMLEFVVPESSSSSSSSSRQSRSLDLGDIRRVDYITQDESHGQAAWHHDGQHADTRTPSWSVVLLVRGNGPNTRLKVTDDKGDCEFGSSGDAAIFPSMTVHGSVPAKLPCGAVVKHQAVKLVFLFYRV